MGKELPPSLAMICLSDKLADLDRELAQENHTQDGAKPMNVDKEKLSTLSVRSLSHCNGRWKLRYQIQMLYKPPFQKEVLANYNQLYRKKLVVRQSLVCLSDEEGEGHAAPIKLRLKL